MSIELCSMSSQEAVDAILEKLRNPEQNVSLGGVAIAHLRSIEHVANDGHIVVRWSDTEGSSRAFQFIPTFEAFSNTASGEDGEPVCTNCEK